MPEHSVIHCDEKTIRPSQEEATTDPGFQEGGGKLGVDANDRQASAAGNEVVGLHRGVAVEL